MSGEQPMMKCPRCGLSEPDYDGFGMLAHTKPAYENGCGYCLHPALDAGACDICGASPDPGKEGDPTPRGKGGEE